MNLFPIPTQALITFIVSGWIVLISACGQSPAPEQCASPAAQEGLPPLPAAKDDGGYRLFELMNNARSQKGHSPLTLDTRLILAASDHSSAMLRTHSFDHTLKGERNFQQRLLVRGYPKSHSSENIAMAPDPDIVFRLWYESPGHYKNMMNPKYTKVGIARSGDYWTADFAAPDGG